MVKYKTLKVENYEGVLTITLNRPESLNSLNFNILDELNEVIQGSYDNEEVRGIIITGAGEKAFAAGADIKEIAELNEVNARKFAEHGQEIFTRIEQSEKPIIAAINGFALGGGCELAMACHIRIATKNSQFGQPETNLGLIPGYGGTQRLTQLVGKGKALELMLTCDMINAEEAQKLGLVNHVAESHDQLMVLSLKMMKKILSKAPLATSMVINCVNAYFDSEVDGYQTEANSFSNCTKSEDFQEGVAAFIEKRKPSFKGE